ncbi:MAG: hypothetical protein PVI40_02805 [Chlamydiota bacterium]
MSKVTFENTFNGAVSELEKNKIRELESKINSLGFDVISLGNKFDNIMPLRMAASIGNDVEHYIERLKDICATADKAHRLARGMKGIYSVALVFQGLKLAGTAALGVANLIIFAPLKGDPSKLIPENVHQKARRASVVLAKISSMKDENKKVIATLKAELQQKEASLKANVQQEKASLEAEAKQKEAILKAELQQKEASLKTQVQQKKALLKTTQKHIEQLEVLYKCEKIYPSKGLLNKLNIYRQAISTLHNEIESSISKIKQKNEEFLIKVNARKKILEAQLQDLDEQLASQLNALKENLKSELNKHKEEIQNLKDQLPHNYRLNCFGSSVRSTLQGINLKDGMAYSISQVKNIYKNGIQPFNAKLLIPNIGSNREPSLLATAKKTALTIIGFNNSGAPHVPIADRKNRQKLRMLLRNYKQQVYQSP